MTTNTITINGTVYTMELYCTVCKGQGYVYLFGRKEPCNICQKEAGQ